MSRTSASSRTGTFRPRSAFDVVQAVLPRLTDGQGKWTPYKAAAALYDSVEIRTTATPPFFLDIERLDDPEPNPLNAKLKPTMILRGPLGERVIAPYGVADATSGALATVGLVVGVAAVVGGVGFMLGRRSSRRAANLSGLALRRRRRRR